MQKLPGVGPVSEPAAFRCPHCNRLLFKGWIQYVEIKCPKCGCIQALSADIASTGPPLGNISFPPVMTVKKA